MKSFSDYSNIKGRHLPYDSAYNLDEGIKQYYQLMVSKFNSQISRTVSSLKKLAPGESSRLVIKMPKVLGEAKDGQVGKVGGEYAEVALLDELYRLFKVNGTKVKFEGMTYNKWKGTIYKKADQSYKKSEKGNKRTVQDVWKKHGQAGAQHLFQKIRDSIGADTLKMSTVTLEHLGVTQSGRSKGDFAIKVTKPTAKELLYTISQKGTQKNSAFKAPHNGLQTGWEEIFLSIAGGGYSTSRSDKKTTPMKTFEKRMQKYRETGDEKDYDKAMAAYENSKLAELDKLGEDLGIRTNLGLYIRDITNAMRETKANGGRSKASKQVVDAANINAKQYYDILKKVIEKSLEDPKKRDKIIKGILKLGGIEKGLDYLSVGVDMNDGVTSAAVSTLGNPEYAKALKSVIKRTYDNFDTKLTYKKGHGLKFTLIDTIKNEDVISFPISLQNNTRILLPTFHSKDLETSEYATKSKHNLLRQFGTFVDLEVKKIGTEKEDGKKVHSKKYEKRVKLETKQVINKILKYARKNKFDLDTTGKYPTGLSDDQITKIVKDMMNGTSAEDAITPHIEKNDAEYMK